jgi:hypothetical protein
MNTSLLVLHVRSNRDVLLARGRARQVARLLGYDVLGQAGVAAAVFEIACRARTHRHRAALHFQVQDNVLHVFARPVTSAGRAGAGCGFRLQKPLPENPPQVGLQDIGLAVRLLDVQSPPDLFAEIRRQNQELLHTLAELRTSRPACGSGAADAARPAA